VLLAGGIGITPIKAMAQALRARGEVLQLHYAGRSQDEMAFADQLRCDLGNDLTTYQSADGKHMDVERIVSTAPADAIFYVCGPGSLINAVTEAAAALNIDPQRVRFERFSVHVDSDAKPISVELRRAGKQLQVSADQSILSAMLDAGIDAPYSCRAGNCKSCTVKVLSGEPDHRDSALSRVEREEQRLMCPCVSRATGDHLVLDV
jgi:ferredoxin-NADP reductase